ncbi:MAG: HEAT repeat domain-containing protein [Chlamydiota bacterium]|nr:HEAT repeat domain-containing protein [Chlamydiota bacterium]
MALSIKVVRKIFHFSYINAVIAFTLSVAKVESSESFNPKISQIFFLIQNGNIGKAIDLYNQEYAKTGKHNFDLLQDIGINLLEIGSKSRDSETKLLSLFGAGISLNEKSLHILQNGIQSSQPQHQIVSLNFLSRYHHEDAYRAIQLGLRSNFLPVRLEAAFHLCNSKSKSAFAQTESLMHKIPTVLVSLFPQFYAAIGNDQSIRILKQLMNHSVKEARIESIQSAVKYQRDELLPTIRILSTHHDPAEQEACAYALGQFHDNNSLPRLQQLAQSKSMHVKLAALNTLYQMGKREAKSPIIEEALKENPFAINLLGNIADTEDLLFTLSMSDNLHTRINATLALLAHADPRCLKPLCEILIRDSRDLAFTPVSSLGKSLQAIKVIPSASQNLKDTPIALELSLSQREAAVIKAGDLKEKYFLHLASIIFDCKQNDLAPVVIRLLENMQTKNSIDLLKTYSQKAGAPLIRNYCNLALYRLGEKGPYFDNLKSWILSKQRVDLIRFRPFVPLEMRSASASYQLTPDETSRLLVESFESFLQVQDDRGIDVLLNTIRNGNRNNKYVLAGLLMRATL